MRTSASSARRALFNSSRLYNYKFTAGQLFTVPRRHLLTSPRLHNHDNHTEGSESDVAEYSTSLSGKRENAQDAKPILDSLNGPQTPSKPRDLSGYGSAARRAGRRIKKPEELPQLSLPSWFLERNVFLRENLSKSDGVTLISPKDDVTRNQNETNAEDGKGFYRIGSQLRAYEINENILREISSLVCVGLKSSLTEGVERWVSSKTDLLLSHPKNGGAFFLDELVTHLASVNKADLIRLDPQDIAEIGGSYVDGCRDTHAKSLSSLGFDVYPFVSRRTALADERDAVEAPEEDEQNADEAREEGDAEEESNSTQFKLIRSPLFGIAQISLDGQKLPHGVRLFGQATDTTDDLKMSSFIEAILNASEEKRGINRIGKNVNSGNEAVLHYREVSTTSVSKTKQSTKIKQPNNSLVVMVKDYTELKTTSAGEKVLNKLHEIVRSRRKDGRRIIIIGTTSSYDSMREITRTGLERFQSEPENGPIRTIVSPCRSHDLAEDHSLRTALINLRNIHDVIRRLSSSSKVTDILPAQTLEAELRKQSSSNETSPGLIRKALGKMVWPFDLVHHIATVALSISSEDVAVGVKHLGQALNILSQSEDAKLEWIKDEQEGNQKRMMPSGGSPTGSNPKPSARFSGGNSKHRMKKLREICNHYEKRLLNGVVNPEKIRTTFADVRAPPETIKALKTLTSLSLVRPEAFAYGVLATDKIPGLLLYGPPGTGKSLLARAVAKESGATVLEVSGADVNDMYVGEGEKNVKAIFSLAKKLSPCIVFIDEADAILGSRAQSPGRTAHREIINQFLRQWDGMEDLSAFIMVATNRPFDLDEASLRRLPRRLLVDLPTEEDREAILKIHLKDEILDPEVSLATLASQTPFYSGSDLKNFAVAAALSCVREEVDNATCSEKRTLGPRHFSCALDEISASISEDMGSLAAIRKFDEKFGDRRGRRKKAGGYGFETVKEGERKLSDSARVRNIS